MNTVPQSRSGQLPRFLRICVRQVHGGARKKPAKGFRGPEGHGENIWVFSHRRSDQIIYSFENKLDGFHDLKQLPFNGKKTKPAKLRKDYWSPFANITFPAGQGSVGRSVFQKLRELKHLHEVAWDDEFRYKRPEEFTAADKKKIAEQAKNNNNNNNCRPVRTKEERGIALNRQKQNSIADIAAVLSGMGRGNKLLTSAPEEAQKQLMEVTVTWANDLDKEFAEEWSSNVTHELSETPSYVSAGAPEEVVAASKFITQPATTEKEAAEAKKGEAQPTPL